MKQTAERFGLSFLENLMEFPLVQEKKALIPYSLAKQKKILPVLENDREVLIAISNPTDLEIIEELRLLIKRPLKWALAPPAAIESAIELQCFTREKSIFLALPMRSKKAKILLFTILFTAYRKKRMWIFLMMPLIKHLQQPREDSNS